MRYTGLQITFQEVPDEVSLSFLISGCPLACSGCHSADSWNPRRGEHLGIFKFARFIRKYRAGITCVLFLGGEWEPTSLLQCLMYARRQGLKTCLYTGHDSVSDELRQQLTFLKTGRWISALGGLSSPTTNQKMIEVSTGRNLNHLFTSKGEQHGTTYTGADRKEDRLHQPLSEEPECG